MHELLSVFYINNTLIIYLCVQSSGTSICFYIVAKFNPFSNTLISVPVGNIAPAPTKYLLFFTELFTVEISNLFPVSKMLLENSLSQSVKPITF